jgi:hypothetical protein
MGYIFNNFRSLRDWVICKLPSRVQNYASNKVIIKFSNGDGILHIKKVASDTLYIPLTEQWYNTYFVAQVL